MARQGITREQVFVAADELREEGIAPTVQTVRDRIGSGSFSTINTHLGKWKAENAAQAVADIPALPDKVQAAFTQIWAKAARIAQEGVNAQREALEAAEREMARERASMAEEIERLEKELEERIALQETTAVQREAESAGRVEAEQQVATLRVENARLDERASAAEKWAGEIKGQFEALQKTFTAAVEQARPKATTRKKAPVPKPGSSSG